MGCALSLSVFSLWQSPRSACRVIALPAKACLTGATCGQGLLPLRRAGHLSFRLQQLQEDLVRQPGQALAPVLLSQRLAPPPQHLVLLRQLSDPRAPPQPQPAVLRRAADGHLGALADGHKLAPRLAQVLAPEQARLHVRGVKAPPLSDGRQGLPRLAPIEHARRLPLQHPLHGPVHVAVPVKGQEAHGAVLLQRRVHKVALRAQHAHRRVAPHAELSHLLSGDAEAPPVVAQRGVKVGAARKAACPHALQHVLLAGQLDSVLEFRYCVLWVLTTQCPSGSRK